MPASSKKQRKQHQLSVRKSCDRCHDHKLKCHTSGGPPSKSVGCDRCRRANHPCVYGVRSSAASTSGNSPAESSVNSSSPADHTTTAPMPAQHTMPSTQVMLSLDDMAMINSFLDQEASYPTPSEMTYSPNPPPQSIRVGSHLEINSDVEALSRLADGLAWQIANLVVDPTYQPCNRREDLSKYPVSCALAGLEAFRDLLLSYPPEHRTSWTSSTNLLGLHCHALTLRHASHHMTSLYTSLHGVEELSEGGSGLTLPVPPNTSLNDMHSMPGSSLIPVFAAAKAFVNVIVESESLLGLPRSSTILASNEDASFEMLFWPESNEIGLQAQHLLPALLRSPVYKGTVEEHSDSSNPLLIIRNIYAELQRLTEHLGL